MPKDNKPVAYVRQGALSVSIWPNEGKDRTFYTMTPQRAYTPDDGKTWENSTSFGRDDLPTLAWLIEQAWQTIRDLEAKDAQRKGGGR